MWQKETESMGKAGWGQEMSQGLGAVKNPCRTCRGLQQGSDPPGVVRDAVSPVPGVLKRNYICNLKINFYFV